MRLFVVVLLLISIFYCQTLDELITYDANSIDDLLLDMDTKITTYLADKKIDHIHKEFIYWDKFPPIEVLKEHLSPFKLIDQGNTLNGIQFIGHKSTENFQVADEELFKHDIYERFGFGKNNGKLITFVIHIEYNENTFDRGLFTTIVSNGLKKCNSMLKSARSIADKASKLLSFSFGGYKIRLFGDEKNDL